MAKTTFILLLHFLISIGAQDIETTTIENISDYYLTDYVEIPQYIDELDTLETLEQDYDPGEFLTSWIARHSLHRILAQMPCGWPEYGIPPLAPYNAESFTFKHDNSVLKMETQLNELSINGLNNMEIHRLKIDGVISKRVNFDFNFPNITLNGNFDTTTTLNLIEIMDRKFVAKGNGKLRLNLIDLRIKGDLKYNLPILIGSAKISEINAKFSLGNVKSELSGFINGIPIGGKINDLIITGLLKYLNNNDDLWNGLINEHVLPVVNTQLEGQNLSKIIWSSISRNGNTCTLGE